MNIRYPIYEGVYRILTFQSVLTSRHESVADLTATVQSGQVRGKCFAVRVAEETALSKK